MYGLHAQKKEGKITRSRAAQAQLRYICFVAATGTSVVAGKKNQMERPTVTGKRFDTIDFTTAPLPTGQYEDCTFINCNFSGTNLSQMIFQDCTFMECNLSLAALGDTRLLGVSFTQCKLLGLHFEHCRKTGLEILFDHCVANLSSFYQLSLKQTRFTGTSLQEADFTEADCSGVRFDQCDLHLAVFDHTNLEKADFSTAVHYSIDPTINKIKKAKFSLQGLPGLLHRFDIDISG